MKERAQGSICSLLPLTLGLAFITFASASEGQEPSEDDLILFAPLASRFTYLMTLDGRWVHAWRAGSSPGNSVYLLPNGDLFLEVTREGETVWSYTVTNGGAADETGVAVFRAERYERGHSGLAGRVLEPGDMLRVVLDLSDSEVPLDAPESEDRENVPSPQFP